MSTGQALLGFDYGLKRIGVAVGQALTGDTRPLATVAARDGEPDWTAIDALIETWEPGTLVVGLPYNVDGSEHAMTAAAGRFAERMEARYGLTVHRVDERYTSLEASRELAGRRRRGGRRTRSGDLDAAAAAIILKDWLEETTT